MISVISQAQDLTPGYNPIYYYFDSTNKGENGFRYLVDVLVRVSGGWLNVSSLKISPNPTTGYCIIDISKILQSYLSNQSVGLVGEPTNIIGNGVHVEYKLQVGESFKYVWEFTGVSYGGATGYVGKVQLNGANPFAFVAGDVVSIKQLTGSTQNNLAQSHTVVYDGSPSGYFGISLDYSSLTIPVDTVTGEVSFSNNNTNDTYNLLEVMNKVAFNGAVPFLKFQNWLKTPYVGTSIFEANFITNQPQVFNVLPDAHCVFNYTTNYVSLTNVLIVENSFGTKKYKAINSPVSGTTLRLNSVGVGPGNIDETWNTLTGTGNIIRPDSPWYDVWIALTVSPVSIKLTKKYRFYLDYSCSEFDSYSISFLDRLGSISSFKFRYKSKIDTKIKRTNQKFLINSKSNTSYVYDTYATSERTIDTNIEESITLNTAWLTQEESDYFQELVSSPLAFMKVNGVLQSVYITETSVTKEKIKNTNNIKYDIKVSLSNNDNINY